MHPSMRFHVTLDPAEEGGYVVQCVEIPGAISQGETVEEALSNIAEAIELILDVRREQARKKTRGSKRRIRVVNVDA
ncbi:MAG: type II toxin-antitoxin system HicB family antitoxin [Thermoplasmatota archaeon]